MFFKGFVSTVFTFTTIVLFSTLAIPQARPVKAILLGEYETVPFDPQSIGFGADGKYFYYLQENGVLTVRATANLGDRFSRNAVRFVSASPDGRLLLLAEKNGFKMISAVDGTVVGELERPIRSLGVVGWSKDGRRVTAWVDKYNVGVFSTGDGRRLRSFTIHERKKLAIQRLGDSGGLWPGYFAPSGDELLTIYGDAESELWDVNSGRLLLQFTDAVRLGTKPEPLRRGEISPDGKWIYAGSYYGGRLWSLPNGRLVKEFAGFQFPRFSQDSRFLGPFALAQSKSSELLDLASMRMRPLGSSYSGRGGVFSPDGNMIILDRTTDEVNKEEAYLFDTATGKMLWSTKTAVKYCLDFVSTCISDSDRFIFSPDSKLLAVSNKKALRLVDPHDGTALVELSEAGGPVVWNPDSRLLVCRSSKTGKVRIYRIG